MAELSQRRKEMQDLLLAGDTGPLQQLIYQNLVKGYIAEYKEQPDKDSIEVLSEAAAIMAKDAHQRTTELAAANNLENLDDAHLVDKLLTSANAALKNEGSRYVRGYADDLTGFKDGKLDPKSDAYNGMIGVLNGTAVSAAVTSNVSAPEVDIDPTEMLSSLFTFHEALKQSPAKTAKLMSMTPDMLDKPKGEDLQFALAKKIQAEAQEKYGLDVTEDQARTASRIMLTEFTKWSSGSFPLMKEAILKDGRQLSVGEVNRELNILATNTRVALIANANALGELGSREAIDALVGTGDSNGSVGLNVTNIAFMTLSNLGDPNVQALAQRRARDSLTVTGKLDDQAIFAGISSLPAAITTNDGIQVQISETAKNYLANAALNAKENCYDQGWDGGFFGRAWEAIWAFFSCLLNSWDFSAAIKSATDVFDSERIEYKNRVKFESSYVNAIANASAAELGYTGDPALFDSYKQYLATSSTQRMFEVAAGVPHMEDVAVSGAGTVSARTAPPTMPTVAPATDYYPGISAAPTTANQAGKAAYDAWTAASKGDADATPLYIQRNGDTPLLVTTMSDAEANKGALQFDPNNHDGVAQAAKAAAAEASKSGKVVIARDINNNNVIDLDEIYSIPKSEIVTPHKTVEIVSPGK